ncbi:hypothetical protein [Aestuariirhabdus litorea]|uniref:Uncharacterized protein n=1 Tax=Aestuariirhabdus litorea TaxID=2528527 RepID=A0A3P3VS00_9GAMM|nr:hypothetical protein [Aestuariirhabdus litorea]RRJ84758.1 hypothetical protein D0544_06570 [Aestuariirhabdus litorea]RWW97982.1 hypothetical protein DZC74_06565 [Endozoicomonadaceae bacterium GTF-13]
MSTLVATVILVTLFMMVFYAVIHFAQKPRRPLNRETILALIQSRIDGTDEEIRWVSFLSLPIHYDPFLEAVRMDCLKVERDEELAGEGSRKPSREACERYREIMKSLKHHFEMTC